MKVSTFPLYELLKQDQLSFIYGGSFDDAITGWVVDLSNVSASKLASMKKLRKKVSFLVVECLQNVVRYGHDEANTEHNNFFMVRLYQNAYYITSSNLVRRDDVQQLEDRLHDINSKNPEELKAFYMEVLQSERGDSRGGGLGMIEMARKSGQKIEFSFEEFDADYLQFIFSLRLSPEIDGQPTHNLEIPKRITQQLKDDQINMVYRGDFSEGAIEPVLNMIEVSLTSQEGVKKSKKVFRAMVELFQNIRRHGVPSDDETIEGLLMIGRKNKEIIISVANFIYANEEEEVVIKIGQLNSMDKEAKSAAFRELLKSEEGDEIEGFGLLEVARNACGPLEYGFEKVNDALLYFEITARF